LLDLSGRFLIPGLDHFVPLNNIWFGMDLTKPPTANPTWALALPALVLVTTWLQSKLTIPQTPPSDDGKPNQAQAMSQSMTTIMPLMFGFFSLSFSVGLSIYFITGNIIGIIQYSLMNETSALRRLIGRGPAEDTVSGKAKPADGKKAIEADTNNSRSKSAERDAEPQPKTKVKTKVTKTK
jgi:YidC/Oxa1 family membrane protein insertase